jgi:hypothetical protein
MPWRFGLEGNGQSGIEVYSRGSITLNRVAAINNDGDGAFLYNLYDGIAKPVTITTSSSDDLSRADFASNGGNGLTVQSHGAITIAHLNASDNGWGTSGGYGAYLDNCKYDFIEGICNTANAVPVTLTGDNTFSWNQTGTINSGYGLLVNSKGAITLNNVIANDNDVFGAILNNNYTGAVGGISVNNSATYAPSFNNNTGSSGLLITSRGSVVLKDFDATNNSEYGVFIDNSFGTGSVTVGTSRNGWSNGVWNNGYSGLEILSYGAVTVWNIWADSNTEYGVYVDNADAGPKPVTFNASTKSNGLPNWNSSDGNGLNGFYILSSGSITLTRIEAWGNGLNASPVHEDGAGVYLDNMTFTNPLAPQNVTINGLDVGNNYYSGIEVWTYGSITGSNFYAESNGLGEIGELDKYGYGAYLVNSVGSISKPVTLSGTNVFEENWTAGLEISSHDAITINNLEAWYNEGLGAALTNITGAFKPVTITGYADVGENGFTGLMIGSRGLITTATLYADGNGWKSGADGVDLNNDLPGATAGVTLNGNNGFYANNGYGLYVGSHGPIKANNLRGEFNDVGAVYLDNDWDDSTAAATVTITGTQNLDFNGVNGLLVYSKKSITISNLNAEGNGYHGAYIQNTDSGTANPQNVTLTGINWLQGNNAYGLVVYSYGTITISNLRAHNNGWVDIDGGSGAWLDNCIDGPGGCLAQTPKAITLTGTNSFFENFLSGLEVLSIGSITINNLSASWNGYDGAYIDNQWSQPSIGGFVTLTGTNTFNENWSSGLEIYSHGTITLSNVTANLNGFAGATIDNWAIDGPQVNVVMNGTNTFNSNGDWVGPNGYGLMIYSEGNITINNLTANWNAQSGVTLNNLDYSFAEPTITLTGLNTFLGNQHYGIVIDAIGSVTLNKVRSDNNGYSGVDVYSEEGGITIACGSTTHNGVYGWYLDASDSITLKAVVALGNGTNFWSNLTPIVVRSC